MPWGDVVANASPYTIVLVLIWLVYQILKIVVEQNKTILKATEAQAEAVGAIKAAQESIKGVCEKQERVEIALISHSNEVEVYFKQIISDVAHVTETLKMLHRSQDVKG